MAHCNRARPFDARAGWSQCDRFGSVLAGRKTQNFWDLDQTHGGTLAAGDTDRAARTKQRQAYIQRLAHLQAYECDTPELDNQDEFNVLKEWNHTEMRLWGPHPKTATGRIIAWQAMLRNLAPMVRGARRPVPPQGPGHQRFCRVAVPAIRRLEQDPNRNL